VIACFGFRAKVALIAARAVVALRGRRERSGAASGQNACATCARRWLPPMGHPFTSSFLGIDLEPGGEDTNRKPRK
jgi:hypothetical protein